MKLALVLVCGSVLILSEVSIYINAQRPQVVRGTVIGVGIPGIREIGPEELGQQGKEGQAVGQGTRGQGRGVRPEPAGAAGGVQTRGQSGEQTGTQSGAHGQVRGVRPELGVTVGAESGQAGVQTRGQDGEQTGEQNGIHAGHERNHTVGHQGEKGESGEQAVEGEKHPEGTESKAAAEGAKAAGSGEVGVSVTPVAVATSERNPGKEPVGTGSRGATTGRSTQT